ncbi:hypothetical protein [Clostridium perfringens]|uniref:hypothetical protein n=1 Tax=Clostridium perfringens TaxID=1502 RepID=UPI00372D12B5
MKKIGVINFGIIFLLIILLMFQNFIEVYVPQIKSLDEAIPYIIFLIFVLNIILNKGIIKVRDKKMFFNDIKIIIALILLIIIGIIGNIKYDYQVENAILPDIIIVVKGFLTYALVNLMYQNYNFDKYSKFLNNTLRIVTIILLVTTILNIKFDFWTSYDIRYGFKSQELFFSHPTYLATFCVCLIVMLTYMQEKFNNKYYIIFNFLIIFSTQRIKAMAFVGIFCFLYYFIIKKNKRLNLTINMVLLIVCFCIGWEQIIKYLSNPDWARSALGIKSILIARDHFPIGSGFATFGTWNSALNYSPLYIIYGLSNIYGLTPTYYQYVSDTYWPAILGQFGVLGLGIVTYIIYKIFRNISYYDKKNIYLAKLSILIYLLILSTAESSFMSPVGSILCLLLAI